MYSPALLIFKSSAIVILSFSFFYYDNVSSQNSYNKKKCFKVEGGSQALKLKYHKTYILQFEDQKARIETTCL
jgi:hypothetical protein